MPLVEKGNKQLDELKKTVGLGNALDAEAVIVVPSVSDEVSKHIAEYGPEMEDALGVGFHRIEHGEVWDIKINDTREVYPSCARSWKRRPDVGSDKEFPDLSARDAAVVMGIMGTLCFCTFWRRGGRLRGPVGLRRGWGPGCPCRTGR